MKEMKKILIVGILSILGANCYAQNNMDVTTCERNYGENTITNKEILGTEIAFSDRIENTYFETLSDRITIQLRGVFMGGTLLKNNGDVILYDLKNKKTLWEKSIDYQNYYLEQNGNFIFKTGLNKTFCLDIESGENLWKARNNIGYINPKLKIGIGYTPFIRGVISYNNTNFEGIDLTTGNSIWKRKINQDFNLNEIFSLNDTIAIIVSSGLHSINLKDGTGWDYNARTGEIGSGNITEIRSNVIIDSLDIYFASKEKISRLDLNGKLKWSCPLPERGTSNSMIILSNDTLYLINTGAAVSSGTWVKHGIPFLAAFDARTGAKIYLNTIDDKRGKIIESVISKDETLLLYKNKIAYCSIENGKLISEKSIDTKLYGDIRGFIGYNTYIKYDSVYKSILLTDTLNQYVYTSKNMILSINKELEVVNQYEMSQLYKSSIHSNKHIFLTSKDNTIVVNRDNKLVAKIDIPGKPTKIGSKLYFVKEKSLIEIDLNQVISGYKETE